MRIEELYDKRVNVSLDDVLLSNKGNTRIIVYKDNDCLPISEYKKYSKNLVEIIEYEDDFGCDDDGRSIILKEWHIHIKEGIKADESNN